MDPVQPPQGNNYGVWKDVLKILEVSVEDETLENIANEKHRLEIKNYLEKTPSRNRYFLLFSADTTESLLA